MGTLQADSEEKQEMDDSGCIQDDSAVKAQVQLLDLSDDVLLLILRHLDPHELKAVGYTCPRLGALVLDRTLWITVDARSQPTGQRRLGWLLAYALHAGTKQLLLSGYAREIRDCMGHVKPVEDTAASDKNSQQNGTKGDAGTEPTPEGSGNADQVPGVIHNHANGTYTILYVNEDDGNHSAFSYTWPRRGCTNGDSCPGPPPTVGPAALRQLAHTCPHLTVFAADYAHINCHQVNISQFPPTLKELSLKGSKCYNLPLDRSFLFKVQDHLPDLEMLDVSECEWMEPASLLPLSKLPRLARLYMRDCHRMTEFVAYASLATRYGFTKLECLDIRGSPFGDSEVSALGWLGALRELRLSPARRAPPAAPAAPPPACEPAPMWEREEPEYYKFKTPLDFQENQESPGGSSNEHDDSTETTATSSDLRTGAKRELKQKRKNETEAGPSKRTRNDDPGTSQEQYREPSQHVLYVNVTQQLHSVYRYMALLTPNHEELVPRSGVASHPSLHIDASSLVTDAAIRRFGRADGEDINYVNIGPNGPYAGNRPNRSSLRHLSITGFRHITDRSLAHLATAAPELRFLDVSETNVTEQGVESFKSFRSDCVVNFSPYVERKDNNQM